MTGKQHHRRATMREVAEAAGVAIKTVSRVVRREPRVSEETRKAVEKAMAELRYRPTISARSTVSARSFQLGLVVNQDPNAYSAQLHKGAQQAARANGYHLWIEFVSDTEDDENLGEMLREFVIQSNLAGVVVPPPIGDQQEVLDALVELDRPFVRIAPRLQPEIGLTIKMDDAAAAREITRHLIELGHRRIAIVKGREGTLASRDRLIGFRAAMKEAGIPVEPWQVVPGRFNLEDGIKAGEDLLSRAERPTAIFASNDQMAVGVMIAAYKLRMRIPDDLSVAGFDDLPNVAAMWSPLTTIHQPVREMGALAVESLIALQRPSSELVPNSRIVPFDLIIRDSTGPAPRG